MRSAVFALPVDSCPYPIGLAPSFASTTGWPWAYIRQHTNAAFEFRMMYQSSVSTTRSQLATVSFPA